MSATDPGVLVFSFPTDPGYLYYLQASTNPSGGEWLNLADPIAGDGGVAEVEVLPGETANAVYRLLAVPNLESGVQP
jgi:hypothetical protein